LVKTPVTTRLSGLAREAAYRTRYQVNAHPSLYMPLARVRHRQSPDYPVSRGTEFVLEGFGRAGSTFALYAFRLAQPRPVRIAHHTHAAAQVMTAVRWGIPTVVIVRPPVDSVLAHMARRSIGARGPLEAWVRYHERILPFADGFVPCSFSEMTTDLGAVIRRVNSRFGTEFGVWDYTPENAEEVFALIDRRNVERFGTEMTPEKARALARPTPERANLKAQLRAQLDDPALAGLRRRADELEQLLVARR
jgi:hypothetical protein